MRLTALLTSLTFLSFTLLPPAACAQFQFLQQRPTLASPPAVTATSTGWALQYDANGNMTQKAIDARAGLTDLTKQLLKFDTENRLVEIQTAQDETVSVTFKPGWNFFALPVIPDDGAVTVLLPSFAQDFEQLARFEPSTNSFKHYVGNPKFDDFAELEYGVGYQLYCKASSPVMVEFRGKLPTKPLSKTLSSGWKLLPALSLTAQAASTAFSGVSYSEVRAYTPGTGALTATTTVSAGQAYWVNVSTASIWSPPLPKNVTSSYVYDGDGGKVKQVTASGTTTYLGEVLEKDPTGKTTKYVFAGSLRIGAKSSDGELLFYHTDHLGSSNCITNASGTMVELTEHLPYGAISHHAGSKDLPHKFTGQRQDPATGLILFPARAYDPQLGRFLQPDPFVQDPADPQTLNRYSYVRNNPVNLVDPSGNFAFLAILGAILVKAAIGAAVGAMTSVAIGAATGQIHGWKDVGRLALSGAASGAVLGGGGYALGLAAKAFELGRTAIVLGEAAIAAAAGAVGGGIDSTLQGGSFGGGAGVGALGGVLGYGTGKALGILGRRSLETVGPAWSKISNQVALSQQLRQFLNKLGLGGADATTLARASQGNAKYSGIDNWKNVLLNEGDTVIGGYPGQSAFYTTWGSLRKVGTDASALFKGLQVAPYKGAYRQWLIVYRVMNNVEAAASQATANTIYGEGGFPQLFIPGYEKVLKPIFSILLENALKQ